MPTKCVENSIENLHTDVSVCRVNFDAVWFQPAILFTVQWIFNNEKYCCKSLHAINFNYNNSASLLGNKSLILENILSFSIHCSPTKMHQHLKFVQCLVFIVTPYKKQNKFLSWLVPVYNITQNTLRFCIRTRPSCLL